MTDEKAYRRGWLAWALYDVGNSAFWLVIVATVFPFFYQGLYVEAHSPPGAVLSDEALKTLRTKGGSSLAYTATIATVIVALLGPLLGSISDRYAAKKKLLALFAGMGALASVLLLFTRPGQVAFAGVLYALGTIGVAGSMVFYDALLPGVAREKDLDRISSIGFAGGYLGSVLLLVLNFFMIGHPEWFGLSGKGQAARVSFALVGVWWAAFTIPILKWVKEPPPRAAGAVPTGPLGAFLSPFRQIVLTLAKAFRMRHLFLFLVAFWIYSDGIGTVIKMAAPFGFILNVPEQHLILALILAQVVGVPCALGFGWLAGRFGAKRSILLGLGVYMLICLYAAFMTKTWQFYVLAGGVGLVQGGTQALSRSLFASLIPRGSSGEFFGFFSTMEKFAGILGPLMLAALWGGKDPDPRRGILAIGVLFVIGALVLWKVDARRGQAEAAAAGPS